MLLFDFFVWLVVCLFVCLFCSFIVLLFQKKKNWEGGKEGRGGN